MGFILDILKEVPLSAVLREQLIVAEKKIALLELENSDLKKLVAQKDQEIGDLRRSLEKPSKPSNTKNPPIKFQGLDRGGNDNMI